MENGFFKVEQSKGFGRRQTWVRLPRCGSLDPSEGFWDWWGETSSEEAI